MKRSRFPEDPIVAILREADRSSVTEVARKHKLSEQAIYGRRQRFGKLEPADAKRLRALEGEDSKLKRLLAEKEMAIGTLKEINRRKWWARRCAAAKLLSLSVAVIRYAAPAS